MEETARLITFTGRVQGVGFRFTAQRIANRYELTGYVKNLPNGQVEMLVQGNPKDIEGCLRDISESFKSMIRDTHKQKVSVRNKYKSFQIAY